jgi:anti-anti-sigma regulatory factor
MTAHTRIELSRRLDIADAVALHRDLLATIGKPGPVELDGTRVEGIDTAILQLLASFWRVATECGKACSWLGISPQLARAAHLTGLAEGMHLPSQGTNGGVDGSV